MELDLGAVRTFVAIAEDHSFGEAADRLRVSQQAVSKRIARLESDLGVTLFFRSRAGAGLTEDGRAFLPHARALVGIADQAVEALRGRRRALRVDVLDTRLASIDLVRGFHQAVEGVEVDVVTSDGLRGARDALARGAVDAVLCRISGVLDDALACVPAYLEPLHLLVGRGHPLAGRARVGLTELAGSTIWMPRNIEGSEWAEFYSFLAVDFDLRIDTSGPYFGYEDYVESVATGLRPPSVAGDGTRLPWHPDLVRIPFSEPVPVYPWWLLRHRQNQHPGLRLLLRHLTARHRPFDPERHWLPVADQAAFGVAAP
ncbi:LysR family transcriptional regulator [Nonomuraea sp. NPDC049480]|uniref:LysR family transcriptional regulator n=1 Tax=Nonomuraea sp. NPDC049480 TaxID=3364353 RepID=UPI00378FCFC4